MKYAKCFSDRHYPIGKIDEKMYSSFTEHLGRVFILEFMNRVILLQTKKVIVRMWRTW